MMRPAMLAPALLAGVVLCGAGGAATAQPADDGLGVGTKLTGTVVRSWAANGKRKTDGGEAELVVTSRSG